MSILFKQAVATIDDRTTNVCLKVAGQITPLDEPFTTLNGEFEMPPFHVQCRTLVVPYMEGMVNTQRTLANVELQNRPLAERDTRGAPTPPPDRGNPPMGSRRTPGPQGPKPTPRSRALDIAELRRGATTVRKATSTRDRVSALSGDHALLVRGINKVLRAQKPTNAQIIELRDTVRAAPLTKTTLWLAVPGATARTFRVGKTVPNPDVAVFSSSRTVARQGMSKGVMVRMVGGRALPVEALSPSPSRHEWLVARTLRVVSVAEDADGNVIVTVETE